MSGERSGIFLFTWAVEDRHGGTTFHMEAVKCDDWEKHVASTIRRQSDDNSGRYVAPWILVFMAKMESDSVTQAINGCR